MTTLDRRTLIARSAAAAALAALGTSIPAPAAMPPLIVDEDAIARATTDFALDLYRQLREDAPGNLLVSPYSIAIALAMTWTGADGPTASQMAATLGLADPNLDVNGSFAALTGDLVARGNQALDDGQGRGEGGLRIANALWGEASYPFAPNFLARLDAAYGAGLRQVDFIDAPDAARGEINAWIAEQTGDRIRDIVPEGAIDAATRLVLANAIWFYGAWQHTFDKENTRDAPFHLANGTTVDVPFMAQTESFAYAALDTFQAVELPYDNGGYAMTIILPDDGQFDAVEAALDPATLGNALNALEHTEIRLFLPRFGFEFAASLAKPLHALGIVNAFDPDRADFSGMVDGPLPPGENLFIGDVLHKAFVAVDEEGTEAAAATVVIIGATSAQPAEPIELRIDRPFLFAIRDTRTGTILFLGRVVDPASN